MLYATRNRREPFFMALALWQQAQTAIVFIAIAVPDLSAGAGCLCPIQAYRPLTPQIQYPLALDLGCGPERFLPWRQPRHLRRCPRRTPGRRPLASPCPLPEKPPQPAWHRHPDRPGYRATGQPGGLALCRTRTNRPASHPRHRVPLFCIPPRTSRISV